MTATTSGGSGLHLSLCSRTQLVYDGPPALRKPLSLRSCAVLSNISPGTRKKLFVNNKIKNRAREYEDFDPLFKVDFVKIN